MTDETSAAGADASEFRDTQTAKKYFDAGQEAEQQGQRVRAIESYQAAFTADPEDQTVCFRLAYNLDLVGEEDEALNLYEQCVSQPNPPLNALLNLAVMYEDRGHYVKAERCVQQVLATDPNHSRARLFMKDILASKQMVIQDEPDRRFEASSALLDTPVTDFELSVRARNCLRKMNIRTLGDLLRISEAELQSFKNVGEASLEEIKAMLAQRGLRLGQFADRQDDRAKQAVYSQLMDEHGADESLLDRSVNELELSVRARKALALLNVQSLGELCIRTEPELMGVKNFGTTSLLEIKEKLAEHGLSLRQIED